MTISHPDPMRLTAHSLADELTAYVRRGGSRKILQCHPRVLSALRTEIGTDNHPPVHHTSVWLPTGADVVAMLTGIDIATDVTMAADEWRLFRVRDGSTIIRGHLEQE